VETGDMIRASKTSRTSKYNFKLESKVMILESKSLKSSKT
jgi:hypothetical protein